MKKLFAFIMVLTFTALVVSGCASQNPHSAASPTATPSTQGRVDEDAKIKDAGITEKQNEASSGGPALSTLGPQKEDNSNVRTSVLYWDSVRAGGSSGSGVTCKLYSDYASFAKDLGGFVPEKSNRYTEESFKDIFVAAVSVTVNTGGYTVGLGNAVIKDGVLTVNITRQSPPAGSMVTQAFETHCVVIALDRANWSEDLACKVLVNGAEAEGAAIG